jgi:hypothetical protein
MVTTLIARPGQLPFVPFQVDEFDTVDLPPRLFRDPAGALKLTS